MVDDQGKEVHVPEPSSTEAAPAKIDTDIRTQALRALYQYAFFDDDGQSFLHDEQGQPITDPTVVSIGPGGFAAQEAAATRLTYSHKARYVGIEPSDVMRDLSMSWQTGKGNPGTLELLPETAETFLQSLASGTTEMYSGMPINILLSRNPFGASGPLSSDKGLDTMVALAEHVTPGGLIGLTFSHMEGILDHPDGSEALQIVKFQERLAAAGMHFEVMRQGKRPERTVSPHQRRALTFPDSGVVTLRKQILPPVAQPAGPVV